ncbi:MAG: hypothetical protein Q9M33_02980, partial [Robiginitomaculum sp.]|nr:hypothetical protein [Robiginitomaculum sp.]
MSPRCSNSEVRAQALAVWRAVEAEVSDPAAQMHALAEMTAAFSLHRSEHRARAHRQRLVWVRAVKYRKMLVASDALPMPVKIRAAGQMAQHHHAVVVSTLARAIGWAGQMALARIRVAPDYDLPAGRFELGLPALSETETPPGRAAIIIAPEYPHPVDLIAVTLRDGKAYRLDLDGPVIPHGRSSLSRRTEESWSVHVHPAAWASARAAAVRAGVSPEAAPVLIANPAALNWTRKGDLGVVKTLNVVDARGDDPADPVHAIW